MKSDFKYLLDTDIASYIIRRLANPVARAMQFSQQFAISSVTRFELGKARSFLKLDRSRQLLDEFLLDVPTIEFDDAAADQAAEIYRQLEASGVRIGVTDSMLAGQAIAHEMVFVTNNQKHFSRIAGLNLQNWMN